MDCVGCSKCRLWGKIQVSLADGYELSHREAWTLCPSPPPPPPLTRPPLPVWPRADRGPRHGPEDPLLGEGDPEASGAQPLQRLPADSPGDRGADQQLRQVQRRIRKLQATLERIVWMQFEALL